MDLKALTTALQASPQNIPLLLLVARACIDEFEIDLASTYIDRTLDLEPDNADALVEKARILDLNGRTSEAILRLETLCGNQPNCALAWLQRARMVLKEGDGRDARNYYERAVSLDSTLADDSLLERIIKSGGATTTPSSHHMTVGADGSLIEPAWDDEDDDDFSGIDAMTARELELEFRVKADIKFEDVGGMESVKEDIRMKIIYPIQKPELFKAYGKTAGGGVLMYGPPGCGKTLLSRATAGEIQANFFSVGLHSVLDMYHGESERKLHKIFELARNNTPAVLFFDEIDALAADRKDMRQSVGRGLINQFLDEMDGAQGDNEGVLILGATNAPWHLDGAFLRPGRFDRLLFVPPPDDVARVEIAKIHARKKPIIDWKPESLAKHTAGFSGADIMAIFDHATEATIAEAMKRGEVVPVTGKALASATKKVKPSTRKWFESAKNYALYANQSGFYDDVLNYMGIKKS